MNDSILDPIDMLIDNAKTKPISITGTLGSGKSTVANILEYYFKFKHVSAGSIFRKAAEASGKSLEEFNKMLQSDNELDRQIDTLMRKEFEEDTGENPIVFDGRLAYHFIPESYKVFIFCAPNIAAERVFKAKREDESYSSPEEALVSLQSRRDAENARYKNMYGIDNTDLNNYDLIIDSSYITPRDLVKAIIDCYRSNRKGLFISPSILTPTQGWRAYTEQTILDYQRQDASHNILGHLCILCGYDGNNLTVEDGHHRWAATGRLHRPLIECKLTNDCHMVTWSQSELYTFEDITKIQLKLPTVIPDSFVRFTSLI